MLETLKIKNIAVIDSAEIPFRKGLNILSGETGAGKSIVIEAISLLLGSRASSELIRSGCDEATVEGLFSLNDLAWIRPRLEKLGFDAQAEELLIKRVVSRNGKHRIYVNGELATVSILQTLCEGLVDLCGQHEHQSLLKPATQMALLDTYGSLQAQAGAFAVNFETTRELERERDGLQAAENERSSRADFLKFQIEELRGADLVANEDEGLAREKQLLQSAKSRVQSASSVLGVLEEAEESVLNQLKGALNRLKPLTQLDDRVNPIRDHIETAMAETEEAAQALNRYLGTIDLDPARLETVLERLSLIADFRRKYGASVDDMIATLARLEAEFMTLDQSQARLNELADRIAQARVEMAKLGRKLSTARHKTSSLLADSVTGELKDLKMGDARFQIELTDRPIESWTAAGIDTIQFVVQTNRGEPARPLGKIVSGGELSRLMLAIRRVISDRGGIGVYLFDEIDAGIGGQTAFQVGKKLKSVAAHNQVICITHLPQVASFAHHHLVVRKTSVGKRTQTVVDVLTDRDRKEELARMLGGPELTKKSLENAAELMLTARSI